MTDSVARTHPIFNVVSFKFDYEGRDITNEFQLIEPTRVVQAITGAYSILSVSPSAIM